jgi:hypothetical protein
MRPYGTTAMWVEIIPSMHQVNCDYEEGRPSSDGAAAAAGIELDSAADLGRTRHGGDPRAFLGGSNALEHAIELDSAVAIRCPSCAARACTNETALEDTRSCILNMLQYDPTISSVCRSALAL